MVPTGVHEERPPRSPRSLGVWEGMVKVERG